MEGPVAERERLPALDALRGFAILGILVMNVQAYSMISAAYVNPHVGGWMEGADYAVWLAGHLLADQKFMTVFSMLFGAGIVLMADRGAAVHYRRQFTLLLFGLAHAYLVWYGDILSVYALCGMALWPARRLPPAVLALAGITLIAVPSAALTGIGWTVPMWPANAVAELETAWRPSAEAAAAETAAYRGGWTQQMPQRASDALSLLVVFAFMGAWRAAGCMCLGMALFKWGLLGGGRSSRVYAALTLGLPAGAAVTWLGVPPRDTAWNAATAIFALQFNYWGSLASAMGWIGVVVGAWTSPAGRRIAAAFAPAGRMALTNYLAQSLIMTTLFYGHGFGLFGRVSRVGQIALVAVVAAFQLAVSWTWLRRFRFGPVEWLWRMMTYGRRPALVRRPEPGAEATP